MANTIDLKKNTEAITLPIAEVGKDYDCELTSSAIPGNTYMLISSSIKEIKGVTLVKVETGWHFKGRPTEITESGGTTFTLVVREVANTSNFFEVIVTFIIRDKVSMNIKVPPCMKDMHYTHTLMDAKSLGKDRTLRIKTNNTDSHFPDGLSLSQGKLIGTPKEDVVEEKEFDFNVELFNAKTQKVEEIYQIKLHQLEKLKVSVTNPPVMFIDYSYDFSLNISGGSKKHDIENASEIANKVKQEMKGITFNNANKSFSGKLTSALEHGKVNVDIDIYDSENHEFKIKVPLLFTSETVKDITKVYPVENELGDIDPGRGYHMAFKADGGYGKLHYELKPPVKGMSIEETTGIITGVPEDHLEEDNVTITIVVTDTPPKSDIGKKKTKIFKDLKANIKHQVSAPLINVPVEGTTYPTELFLAPYFPRGGRDLVEIILINGRSEVTSINGRYGNIKIKPDDKFTIIYTPHVQADEGVDVIHYKISNGPYSATNTMRFDVLHKLQASSHTTTAGYGEMVTVNLSKNAVGGPFDSALTGPYFTSANSFCKVTNESDNIMLRYRVPDRKEFSGSELVIDYALVKRIHTSQLAKVTIKIQD